MNVIRIIATGLLLFCLPPQSGAQANDRMAGGTGDSGETKEGYVADAPLESHVESPEAGKLDSKELERLESLGNLSSFSEGALGRDVWLGAQRQSLTHGLLQLDGASLSRDVNKLLLALLQTRNDAELIENDADVRPGFDLATLRILALLKLGAYRQALDLYGLVRGEPYHPNLAQAGVLAMLGSGNVSLACLESRSTGAQFEQTTFWAQLSAICDKALGEGAAEGLNADQKTSLADSKILQRLAGQKRFRMQLGDNQDFSKLSPLERAAIFGLKRLDYAPASQIRFDELSSEVLGLALLDDNLPYDWRYKATIEFVRRGLLSEEALDEFYEDRDCDAPPPPEDVNDASQLPELFAGMSCAPRGAQQWEYISRAIRLANSRHWPALIPFSEVIIDASPDDRLNQEELIQSAALILRTGNFLPENWSEKIRALAESDRRDIARKASLVLLADSFLNDSSTFFDLLDNLHQSLEPPAILQLAHIAYAMEVDDAKPITKLWAYEKILGLTHVEDYVMQSVTLLNYFSQAQKNKALGEVIVLSASIFRAVEPENTYPGVMRSLLEGYRAVGLKEESRMIAVGAILGMLNEKGE